MVVASHGGTVLGVTGIGPGGTVGSVPVGLVMGGHALPVAFQDSGDPEDGFRGVWESTGDVDQLFRLLDLDHLPGPGLWVLTSTWEENHTDPDWGHLWSPDVEPLADSPLLGDVVNSWDGWGWP